MRNIPQERGNILTDPESVIVIHQCNTQNKFGSGMAKAIREAFPAAYEADTMAAMLKMNVLGDFSWAKVSPEKYIFNVYAQDNYGKDGRLYTNYDALKKGLTKVRDHVEVLFHEGHRPTIALPKIGCGTGGGDWTVVKEMIEEVFSTYEGKVKIVDFNI